MASKYHTELMVETEDGRQIPRRKAVRISKVEDTEHGKVRRFATRGYGVNADGSLNSGLPKQTKAEKKLLKRAKVALLKGGK